MIILSKEQILNLHSQLITEPLTTNTLRVLESQGS